VTAAYNGSSQTASILLVAANKVSQVSCNPTSLISEGTSACTVTLSQAAGPGGITVTLSSNAAALEVPPTVNVTAGAIAANFTATAGTITTSQTAVVTASYNGSSQAAISLLAPVLVNQLSCAPTSVTSGATSACAVTLSSLAGSNGVTVALSSNAAALTVPSSVTVAAGSSAASFAVSAGTVSSDQTAIVTASLNGASQSVSISLQASQGSSWSIACYPDLVRGGRLNCTVWAAETAPAGGTAVGLQANTARVQVPAQVVIPAGTQEVQFVATVTSSDQDIQAQITASATGVSAATSVPITGIRPTGVSCSPQTISAGSSFTCTIGMNTPNVPQVALLVATSDDTNFEFPNPFPTRLGQAQLAFEVFTTPLAGQQSSIVSVQFGQTVVTDSVVVTPAAAPVLNLLGQQLAAFGEPMAFKFSAVDPGRLPLVLSAANLPPGASFDAASGIFSWTPQAPSGIADQLDRSSPLEVHEVAFTATDSENHASTGFVMIDADPGRPVITDLRNAGSQISQVTLPEINILSRPASMSCTPGSVASLIGRWLTTGTQPASDPSGRSSQLAGAQVNVNGNPTSVVYAAPTRVDFICPATIAGGELEISAQIDGVASKTIHANQKATLGLYSTDGSGKGQGMVTLSGTTLFAAPRTYLNIGQPAEPGDTISILASGAGLEAGPSLPAITIGGVSTTASQVQPMPGMAGVYQIELTVPAGVAPGDAVPVVIQTEDSSGNPIKSNTVTIAIEPAE